MARQGDVQRLGAVAVDDGGDLVVATDAAGGALAELGAGLGCDLLGVRHVALLVCCEVVDVWWAWAGNDKRHAPDRERGAVVRAGPVDHGVPGLTGSLAEAT